MWARWTGWDLAARQVGVVVILEFKAGACWTGIVTGRRYGYGVRAGWNSSSVRLRWRC